MRQSLILILTILIFNLKGSAPQRPYSFGAPDFKNLLPLDEEQLLLMKKQGVKRMTLGDEEMSESTVYYLDSSGKVYKQMSFNYHKKKKKRIAVDSIFYVYNKKSLLISKKFFGEYTFMDTIAYDTAGRIIFYMRKEIYLEKRNKITETRWSLNLLSKEGSLYCLAMDDGDKKPVIWLNEHNQVVKYLHGARTDSLARTGISNDSYVDRYFFKDSLRGKYSLGKECFYKSNLLSTEIIYDEYYGTVNSKTDFIYSEDRKLLEEVPENHWRNAFHYVYSEDGLLDKEISAGRQYTLVYQYNYYYR